VGFFDLFKDPLERHLEQVYIPSYRMMGMSEQEARAMFKQVFDSSPAILAVSPFAMERQLYSLATHGATS
jgi:hypothetical protein